MKRIYTYFNHVPSMNSENEMKLILRWRDNWTNNGFEPFVLNEHIARKHPEFPAFAAAVERIPTTNSKEYETACWYRWLAMAQVGGGLMADYDVFGYGYRLALEPEEQEQLVCFTQNAVPCMVFGPAEKFLDACRWFVANADYNGRHDSDMYALQRRVAAEPGSVICKDVVKEFTESGWEQALAVHYCNSRMHPAGKVPRHEHITTLRI